MTTPELGDDEPVLVRPNKDDYDNLDEYAADDEKALDEYMEKMDAWEARREARRAVASAPAPPSPPLDKVVASDDDKASDEDMDEPEQEEANGGGGYSRQASSLSERDQLEGADEPESDPEEELEKVGTEDPGAMPSENEQLIPAKRKLDDVADQQDTLMHSGPPASRPRPRSRSATPPPASPGAGSRRTSIPPSDDSSVVRRAVDMEEVLKEFFDGIRDTAEARGIAVPMTSNMIDEARVLSRIQW